MKDAGRGVLFPERMELDVFKRQKEPRSELEWRGGGNNVGAEVGGTDGHSPRVWRPPSEATGAL